VVEMFAVACENPPEAQQVFVAAQQEAPGRKRHGVGARSRSERASEQGCCVARKSVVPLRMASREVAPVVASYHSPLEVDSHALPPAGGGTAGGIVDEAEAHSFVPVVAAVVVVIPPAQQVVAGWMVGEAVGDTGVGGVEAQSEAVVAEIVEEETEVVVGVGVGRPVVATSAVGIVAVVEVGCGQRSVVEARWTQLSLQWERL